MNFLSVCSGIEAASVAFKKCAKCGIVKALSEFHKQPRGPLGRHSYCKVCANQLAREKRDRSDTPDMRRKWNLQTRYGITQAQYEEIKVRGILCHGCNIKLPAVDDPVYLASALRYLGRSV